MGNESTAVVGIVMGGKSDWETMQFASHILAEFGIKHEARIVSAHRTPEIMFDYAKSAEARGLHVIIAGAGGAAHLPGMMAALTLLPVIGVPVESRVLRGVDSLLSIVQMPTGVPVATMSIGPAGAKNAGILAAQILALADSNLRQKLLNYRRETAERIEQEKLT
jgi:5-(carboxyamino)imidazole ribonucleotide mutase